MRRTTEGWIEAYQQKDALWIHNDDPLRPHALLTSGKHSNGFFNSRLVIPDVELLEQAAADLVGLFDGHGGSIATVEMVVGPQTGATKLAALIANEISYARKPCHHASPAKDESGNRKTMRFTDDEKQLLSGKRVLLCEDVLTTGGSVELAATAVAEAGGITLPFILVLVNRSGLSEVEGKRIVALIDRAMPMWDPDDCPLCKKGSEALRPKENWGKLTAGH